MRPTDTLRPLLEEMFTTSADLAAGVHRKLPGGLHVKAAVKGERRMLIVWRTADRLPSARECEVVGAAAGMITPTFRSWQCRESQDAFLVTEGFTGQACTHDWNTAPVEGGHASTCGRCGATWERTRSGRARTERLTYNGEKVSPARFAQFLERGPAGKQSAEQAAAVVPAAQEPLWAAPEVQTPLPPPPPRHRPPRKAARPSIPETPAEQAERARLIGLLTCITFWSACWSPWFQRAVTIDMRRATLRASTLDELRDEIRSVYVRRTLPYAVPYVLLACRWRHMTRALPERATPKPKTRRPSQKTTRKAKTA
ncbi:hypothetical protein GCM10017784_07130 [Deinococcus indicus]|uniref:hypothetical protein n=1 Tax=Deinococcus indicus TaxID=223556 RepID=UPI00174C8F0F|nr:hypothetical protein [Deinococcus indicus]GHG18536.1 hypothetical protein GCM10017784_07130 [Deinococcus indicus]